MTSDRSAEPGVEDPPEQAADAVLTVDAASSDDGAPAADGNAEAEASFALELPAFHGPLDLLLHLIEQEELDITEVSLLAVTEQYLRHLHNAEQISLGALAEFIAVGARLLLLKSRALLPRDPDAEPDEDEDGDPAALVAALEEYRRFRLAADHLRQLEEDHRTGYRREAAPPELPPSSGLDGVSLDALLDIFREVLERVPEDDQPELAVVAGGHQIPLADRIDRLTDRLDHDRRMSFRQFIGEAPTRTVVIVDFLAVLELLKVRYLRAQQEEAFGDIELVRIEGAISPRGTLVEEQIDADFGPGTSEAGAELVDD